MPRLIDVTLYPVCNVLDSLLRDKTTGKNIIWATDAYSEKGEGFHDRKQIVKGDLLSHPDIIKPRIAKSQEEQQARTRKKAEVFTPVWLCCQMNNYCDEEWFGRKDVFNRLKDDHTWEVTKERVAFTDDRAWKSYIDSRRLEITCGEAPFLVSRYDAATGELIVPPVRRVGMLDRKLRVVNENARDYEEWMKWCLRSFEAVYGYEYQGDSLLIARINLLMTFMDYYNEKWQKNPSDKEIRAVVLRIAWNIWQMDGFKDTVPLGKPVDEYHQLSLFESGVAGFPDADEPEEETVPLCRIFDWRARKPVVFHELKGERV